MKRSIVVFLLLSVLVPVFGQNLYYRELRVVSPRMNGEDVLGLQEALVRRGYRLLGEVDGYFGPLTLSEVNRYQVRNGISVTESVDRDLYRQIVFAPESVRGDYAQDPTSEKGAQFEVALIGLPTFGLPHTQVWNSPKTVDT